MGLLGRLRSAERVLAPGFDRTRDDVVDDAVEVPACVRLVVVEGNYRLVDDGVWAGVRPLLDEVWYLDFKDAVPVVGAVVGGAVDLVITRRLAEKARREFGTPQGPAVSQGPTGPGGYGPVTAG